MSESGQYTLCSDQITLSLVLKGPICHFVNQDALKMNMYSSSSYRVCLQENIMLEYMIYPIMYDRLMREIVI